MRLFIVVVGLVTLAVPASAALQLSPGLDTTLTFDFRGSALESAPDFVASEGKAIDAGDFAAVPTGVLTVKADGPGPNLKDDDQLVRSVSGLGVGKSGQRELGLSDEINTQIGKSESITFKFLTDFALRSVSLTNAGGSLADPTGIRVFKNGSEDLGLFNSISVQNSAGELTHLIFSGLHTQFHAGETLRFSAQGGCCWDIDSYTIAGLTEVPLPAAAWLFLGGLAGIGGYLRYGRRAAAA